MSPPLRRWHTRGERHKREQTSPAFRVAYPLPFVYMFPPHSSTPRPLPLTTHAHRYVTPNKGWTQLLVLAEGSGDFHLANFGHPAADTPPGALASVDVAAQPYMWYTYLAHEEEPLSVDRAQRGCASARDCTATGRPLGRPSNAAPLAPEGSI